MQVKDKISKECKLPAMPHVAMKLLQVVNDPMAKVDDLQRVILADSALTARILKVANSAYYGLPRKVQTLSDAILLLGFSTIKNIALGMALREVFVGAGFLEMKLWEHSLGVAIGSGLVASRTGNTSQDIERAFIAGLLHDIGKAVLNYSFPELFVIVYESVVEEKVPTCEVEKEVFGFDHQDVAEYLFGQWQLPEDLCLIVGNHHRCHNIDANSPEFDLCRIVRFSDTLCLYLGVGYRGPQHSYRDCLEAEADAIGIEFEETMEEFKERYIAEKTLFTGH
ncbi:MAG: HDOD domain-containing protein [Nitrospirae bacterium]|nr:MAG: HDOD domain-containing protein [Nitrospirota bacterium]